LDRRKAMPGYDNPRYILYAKAHGCTPDEMMERDKKDYLGVCMLGFILWNTARLNEYKALIRAPMREPLGTSALAKYDEWLAEYVQGVVV
jgi:hypothetical protein